MFFEEFSRFLEAVLFTPELIICGDLNFHVHSSSDPVAVKFLDLLDTFNLKKNTLKKRLITLVTPLTS